MKTDQILVLIILKIKDMTIEIPDNILKSTGLQPNNILLKPVITSRDDLLSAQRLVFRRKRSNRAAVTITKARHQE